jgi:hypothetical protein
LNGLLMLAIGGNGFGPPKARAPANIALSAVTQIRAIVRDVLDFMCSPVAPLMRALPGKVARTQHSLSGHLHLNSALLRMLGFGHSQLQYTIFEFSRSDY